MNIVDDTFMWFCRGRNELWARELLCSVGSGIGIKLFEDCTTQDIRTCRRNRLTVLADDSGVNLRMATSLESKGLRIFGKPLPKGYSETIGWLKAYSSTTEKDVSSALEKVKAEYASAVAKSRGIIEGIRVMIIATRTFRIDWIIECLLDAGASVEEVCIFRVGPGGSDFNTRFSEKVRFRWDLNVPDITTEVENVDPDIVIGSPNLVSRLKCRVAHIPQESLTHKASAALLEYVCSMLIVPPESGWKSWRFPHGL